MKNADRTAAPNRSQSPDNPFGGITKREMFAINLMAAYRSQPETMEAKPEQVAEWAIEDADALLKELEK